eukprot:TRINITY_DN13844_c0_g1_i1.p1 TRINITY_DN13844_c0_g1~~TRINITY_DN13844_c0_g1_i1.p1  ORF type:complete len:275 (+),score=79.17 TRINITY_DN13844_c0_g1_i1:71-826(+)
MDRVFTTKKLTPKTIQRIKKFKREKELNQRKYDPINITMPPNASSKILSSKFKVRAIDILKKLIKDLDYHPRTANEPIPNEIADEVAKLFYFVPQRRQSKILEFDIDEFVKNKTENLVKEKRPPVVAIMGHVDHGKTTLLDTLRNTDVAKHEHGGITQKTSCFSVKCKIYDEEIHDITFIDTPGHSSFFSQRKRGTKVTDMIVLILAADSGIQPQTLEVIELAQSNDVPLIVAINKIDVEDAGENIKKDKE